MLERLPNSLTGSQQVLAFNKNKASKHCDWMEILEANLRAGSSNQWKKALNTVFHSSQNPLASSLRVFRSNHNAEKYILMRCNHSSLPMGFAMGIKEA